MARIFAVEEWLRSWAVGDFAVLERARDITDIDPLCDCLVKDLKNKATKNDGVLVVCADWKPFETSRRYEQNGVRLLKHLRLTPDLGELRRMHAIILSFEPIEELIRRQPGSQVLLSRGVTFLRLPEGLERLKDETFLAQRAKALADLRGNDFLAAVRADYRPPDSAHEMSNWWGVRQFHAARVEIHPNEKGVYPLPPPVQRELRKTSNLEALFLFGEHNRRRGCVARQEASAEFAELQIVEKAVKHCFTGECPPRLVLVDDDADLGWEALLRRSLLRARTSSECLQVVRIPKPPEPAPSFDAEWVRSNILCHDPDLVLLDLRLLGNREVELPVAETSGVKVLRELRSQDCGLPVIMMTASNKYWTFRETLLEGADGYWMKEGVGEHRPSVSLARHCDELLELVLRCVSPKPVPSGPGSWPLIATGGYSDLRRFSRELRRLKECPTQLWWESRTWDSVQGDDEISLALKQSKADRKDVLRQIESALFLFRDYLRLFENRQGFVAHSDSAAAASEQLRAIVMAGGKVVEYVHGNREFAKRARVVLKAAHIGRDKKDPNSPGRGDLIGQRLHAYRSDSAHADSTPPCRDAVRDYLALLLTYLQIPPCEVPLIPSPSEQDSPSAPPQSPRLIDLVKSCSEFQNAYLRIKGGGRLWIDNQLARKN
jgi:CheY-like chemotaxis protein